MARLCVSKVFDRNGSFEKNGVISAVDPNFSCNPRVTTMHAPSWFYSLCLCITLASCLPYATDAVDANVTLDSCRINDDCSGELKCWQLDDASFTKCTASDYNTCQCGPSDASGFTPCESSSDACPPAEGCGIVDATGDQICLSCRQIRDPASGYTAVDDSVCTADSLSATPSTSPSSVYENVLRRSLDWCLPSSVECGKGLDCVNFFGGDCELFDIGCYCLYRGSWNCNSAKQCSDPDETCALQTERNSLRCVSCTAVLTDIFNQPYKNQKCKNSTPLPSPPFPPPPNGLAQDQCVFDLGCQSPYNCTKRDGKPCTQYSRVCSCTNVKNGTQLCEDSSECRSGELCAEIKGEPSCLSISYVKRLPETDYQVLGEVPGRGDKLTGDSCTSDEECVDGLYCSHETNRFPPGGCIGRRACSCWGLSYKLCVTSDDCHPGEVCVNTPDARSSAYCYSAQVAAIDPYVRDVSETEDSSPTTLPADGWTGDICKKDADCEQTNYTRVCRHFTERLSAGPCSGREFCVCKAAELEKSICLSDLECPEGEICVKIIDSLAEVGECLSEKTLRLEIFDIYTPVNSIPTSFSPIPKSPMPDAATSSPSVTSTSSRSPTFSPSAVPVSPSASVSAPSPSPSISGEEAQPTADSLESNEVVEPSEPSTCIDAEALQHLPSTHLVYATARRAVVLCDEQESCATSGHIVHWHAMPMMMRTYCEHFATCTRRIKHVNSPRMRRRLRIPSRTIGLEFTPLAARFATHLEEAFLRQVLSFGF